MYSGDPASPQQYHFQDSHWGEEQEYPYAHQYASEHNTYIMMSTMTTSTTNTTIQRKVTLMKVGKVNGITIPCKIMGRNPKKILRNRLKVRKTIAPKEKACC